MFEYTMAGALVWEAYASLSSINTGYECGRAHSPACRCLVLRASVSSRTFQTITNTFDMAAGFCQYY